MRSPACSQEGAILRASRSGAWTQPLRDHLASCAACKEATQVSLWMQGIAKEEPSLAELPDSELILWKARLAARQSEARRAQRPLVLAEVGLPIVAVIAVALWLVRNVSELQSATAAATTSLGSQLWNALWFLATPSSAASSSLFSPSVLLVALLCLAAVAVAPLLAED